MSASIEKTAADLMALAKYAALEDSDAAWFALDQAIRRAVDWGKPVAYAPADVLAELKTTNSGLMLSSDDYAVPLVPLYARNRPQ